MPPFARCMIGLGCPQNVSVTFQPKIPHRSFIITTGKGHFWGVSKKRADLKCMALNANELHIPASSQEEGVMYKSLCIAYLQQ